MKRMMTFWVLFGALAASAALNVYHAKTPTEPVLPELADLVGSAPVDTAPIGTTPVDTTPFGIARRVVIKTKGPPCCPLVETVKLTATQKQEIAVCCPIYAQQRAQLDERITVLLANLERELAASNPDTARLHELADQIGELRAEELKSRVNAIVLVRKTLTPSQLERLADCCGKE